MCVLSKFLTLGVGGKVDSRISPRVIAHRLLTESNAKVSSAKGLSVNRSRRDQSKKGHNFRLNVINVEQDKGQLESVGS